MGSDRGGPGAGGGNGGSANSNGGLGPGFGGLGGLAGFGAGTGNDGGGPADSGNPGGWSASYGMNQDGSVSPGSPNGGLGDSGNSLATGIANLGSYGKRDGGFFDGGVLGNTLSTVNTLASLAVPGYAPIGFGLSLANQAVGAANSLGLTDTGSLSPSFGDLARMTKGALGDAPGLGVAPGMSPVGEPSLAAAGIPSAATDDPSGMLGNLSRGGDAYDPLTQALVQQQSLPSATTPTTSMPPQPGVPDPRSLAGLMARHNPMMPVQRG